MSQSRFNTSLATERAVNVLDVRVQPPQPKRTVKAARQELEVKLAGLQQDYAELRTEIFEAAQVHRRLCAPRHVRFGDFEIASEIFAVRHLPGDFFTVEEKNDGVILALGDICGKGLAAGMWTTHLVGLVGARVAVTSKPEAIVAGVNRDICLMKSFMPLASLFLVKLDPTTGVVKYCSAGLCAPQLRLEASIAKFLPCVVERLGDPIGIDHQHVASPKFESSADVGCRRKHAQQHSTFGQ